MSRSMCLSTCWVCTVPSDDDDVVERGLANVKTILAENYVRPDEAEKIKSLIREKGTFKIIDKVSVPA